MLGSTRFARQRPYIKLLDRPRNFGSVWCPENGSYHPTAPKYDVYSTCCVVSRANIYTPVLNGVLCGIALLVTAFRLYLRYTRSKLWWDDFWVVVSALFVIGLIVVNFLHTANPGK